MSKELEKIGIHTAQQYHEAVSSSPVIADLNKEIQAMAAHAIAILPTVLMAATPNVKGQETQYFKDAMELKNLIDAKGFVNNPTSEFLITLLGTVLAVAGTLRAHLDASQAATAPTSI